MAQEGAPLGDLGILTVPLEGDLGPLLEAFDQAQRAAEKAGADAAAAFEAGQISQQSKVAAEAADAFATMGKVQVAAAQQAKAKIGELSQAMVPLEARGRRAADEAERLGIRLNGTAIAAQLTGRALGELSGAGSLAGSVMGRLASRAGPWGAAFAAVAAAVLVLVRSLKLVPDAAAAIQKVDAETARQIQRSRELLDAGIEDAQKGTNTAELVTLQHALEDAQERVRKAQVEMEKAGSLFTTDPAAQAARKEEADALGALAIARDELAAAEQRQAQARAKAAEEKKDEAEKKSKGELTDVLDEVTAARRRLAEETAGHEDLLRQALRGDDPELSRRRRELGETRAEAARLMQSPVGTPEHARGFGLTAVADDMERALEAYTNLQEALREKESKEEFRRIWRENTDAAADALEAIEDLARTSGEKEIAALQVKHARELREIRENERLKASVKGQVVRLAQERQAAEMDALHDAQAQEAAEAQAFIERAIAEETAEGTEKQVLQARERYDRLRELAREHGLDMAAITRAEEETVAAIRAAGAPTDTSDEAMRARRHELYQMGLKQKDIREMLRQEGFQVEETADAWNSYSSSVSGSVQALEAMRRYREQVAKQERAARVSSFDLFVGTPSGVDPVGVMLNRRAIPGVTDTTPAPAAQRASTTADLKVLEAKAPPPVVEVHTYNAVVEEDRGVDGRVILNIEGQLARRSRRGGQLGRTLLRMAGQRRRGSNR